MIERLVLGNDTKVVINDNQLKSLNIGIDLSTKFTGIGCYQPFLNKINSFIISFGTFSNSNFKDSYGLIKNAVKKIVQEVGFLYYDPIEVNVGIELANFKNAKLTNRFNLYAGMFISAFLEEPRFICKFKTFNSNQWQKLVGCTPNDERGFRKQKAKDFIILEFGRCQLGKTEDEYDAMCIAKLLDKIQSTEEIHTMVQNRKKQTKNIERQILNITRKINTRLNKVVTLDAIKNIKKIEKLNQEIKDLEMLEKELKEQKNDR